MLPASWASINQWQNSACVFAEEGFNALRLGWKVRPRFANRCCVCCVFEMGLKVLGLKDLASLCSRLCVETALLAPSPWVTDAPMSTKPNNIYRLYGLLTYIVIYLLSVVTMAVVACVQTSRMNTLGRDSERLDEVNQNYRNLFLNSEFLSFVGDFGYKPFHSDRLAMKFVNCYLTLLWCYRHMALGCGCLHRPWTVAFQLPRPSLLGIPV